MKQKTLSTSKNMFGISLLRVVATFSVIVIHVSGPLVVKYGEISNFNWNVVNVYDSFSRYSIPMFFMISGSLMLSRDYRLKDFLKKRFVKILPAFLFWSLIYSLFNRYIFNDEMFNVKKIIRDVFYGSEYHLWFIYTLLGIYLFTPILREWIKKATRKDILYVLVLWCITLFMTMPVLKNYLPRIDLGYFSGFIGYFILGYYLTKYNSKSKTIPVIAIVLGLTITVLGTYLMTTRKGYFYDYFYEYLSLNAFLISYGVFVSLVKATSSSNKVNITFKALNDCCYGIFLMHPLVLKLLDLIGVNVYIMSPLTSVFFVSVVCFLVCFLLILGFRQFKVGYIIS